VKVVASIVAALLLVLGTASPHAQTSTRQLATIDALRRFPGYYHLKNVLVRGEFEQTGPRAQLKADERLIDVVLAEDVRTTSGPVEVRAQLVDVGRLERGDPRLAGYSPAVDPERWPRPGEELFLSVRMVASVEAPLSATIRSLALEPWRYENQTVTLVGQFRGRNLFGDLPGAPAKSRYDFVLRSGDASVWVTGLRPRGRGFELDVDARVDTGRWLVVTGIVRRERSLVTIEGARLETSAARTEPVSDEPAVPPPPPMPVDVVFSSPSPDETDVPTGAAVRIQFSRGLAPATVAAGFAVTYVGGPALTATDFRTSYDVATRSVEIRFINMLTPFRSIRIETRDTLKGFDGATVTPWTLTFGLGG
jgi:hypothetical protein